MINLYPLNQFKTQALQAIKQELNITPNRRPGNKTIFISRDLSPNSIFLTRLAQAGYDIFSGSLIEVSPIRYTYTPPTQWVFFTSKNAIRFFFEQHPLLKEGTKFGVMSKASAKFLANYGKQADFVGEGIDVRKIAKAFASHIGNETVMFPQAIDSLQSIQKELSFSNNCYNLYVYKTSLKTGFTIPPADVLTFTSPSNATAYYNKYEVRSGQKVVAIGASTFSRLKDLGVKNVVTAPSFDEEGLAKAALQIIG